jgi:hypothetical protein
MKVPRETLGLGRQRLHACALSAVLATVAWSGWSQGTTTITFDGPAFDGAPSPTPPGRAYQVTQYDEGGVHFWKPVFSLNSLRLMGGDIAGYPDNSTAYLLVSSDVDLAFKVPDSPFGTLFGLVSLDLAESYTGLPGPRTLTIIGYGGMGYAVTNTITTDGINDGTGPLQDFQTFTFGPEWAHIQQVDILNGGFSLDNIVPSGIPEPSCAALLSLGMAGWCWLRRGRSA